MQKLKGHFYKVKNKGNFRTTSRFRPPNGSITYAYCAEGLYDYDYKFKIHSWPRNITLEFKHKGRYYYLRNKHDRNNNIIGWHYYSGRLRKVPGIDEIDTLTGIDIDYIPTTIEEIEMIDFFNITNYELARIRVQEQMKKENQK